MGNSPGRARLASSFASIGMVIAAATAWAVVGRAAMPAQFYADSLAGGTANVVACDHDGVKVTPTLRWADGYVVDRVQVSGIADACVGRQLTLVMDLGSTSVVLGPTVVVPVRRDDNVVSMNVPSSVRALDFRAASVVIQ